jgi:hypothetical protein
MFRIVRLLTVAAVIGFAAVAAGQGAAPALLTAAVSATQAAKTDYAFDFELETSKQNWRARFDPRANPRLRLVQPRREELKGDERRAFDRLAEQMEGVSWCASENMARVENVRLVREDEASATYAFQPSAENIRGAQARRFADRLRGEMTLIKASPDISRIRLYAPEAFSPMPLVRIDQLSIVITCQTAPNGRRYAAETVTDLRGSALGQAFSERSVQRARNLTAP